MTEEVPEHRNSVSFIAKAHRESMGEKKQYGFDFPRFANIPNDNTLQSPWEVWVCAGNAADVSD